MAVRKCRLFFCPILPRMKKKGLIVQKASGELVPFDEYKLKRSLQRSGADDLLVKEISRQLSGELYPGISTGEIYRKAFALLRSSSRPLAARYRLKNAIMELGPSGFPFEKYFAELLKNQGVAVRTNIFLEGTCVSHEVDVLAETDGTVHFIECKFHNDRGLVTDVKVPLYIHSRFRDIESRQKNEAEFKGRVLKGWVVTNTKFSEDAVKYGLCAALELVGWDFPKGRSLRDIIDITGLYPVTCLTTITQREKQWLLEKGIVLCRQFLEDTSLLQAAGIKGNRVRSVQIELQNVCAGKMLKASESE